MMKMFSIAILLVLFGFLSACSDSPGPLAPGYSRIEVKCGGFSDATIDAVPEGEVTPVAEKDLECFFYGEINLDVPVPPEKYTIRADREPFEKVAFTGSGEKKTVWYYDITVPSIPIASF